MWPARIAEYLPTAAAIPTYLALVGLAVGGEYRPSVGDGIILLVAPGLFLVASALFALGYLPVQRRFSLDLPAEVEEARAGTIRRRYRFATFGFIVFALGTTWAIAGVTYALSIETPAKDHGQSAGTVIAGVALGQVAAPRS